MSFLSSESKGINRQLQAALSTLEYCINECPTEEWQEKHKDAPFSQVVFHTLFYCDFYLSGDEAEFKNQAFHRENMGTFDDYEELEYRAAVHLYEKEFVIKYLKYCREKIRLKLQNQTCIELNNPVRIGNKEMTGLELFIYVARHIQHHAAQLGLRIQYLTGKEMKWFSQGE